jgi:hypothetical protein
VRKIIGQTSGEYEKNVGIALKLVEYHETLIPVAPSEDRMRMLRTSCKNGEIVAVFTDQEYIKGGSAMFGWSDKKGGILWDYEVEYRRRNSTRWFRLKMLARTTWQYHHLSWGEQEEPPEKTFKHKLAHLFGVEHSPNATDFMFRGASSASWSDRIREAIRAHRDTTWGVPLDTDDREP